MEYVSYTNEKIPSVKLLNLVVHDVNPPTLLWLFEDCWNLPTAR
jgi:hypothetical protein